MPSPAATPSTTDAPGGNLGAALDELLGTFGVVRSETRATAEETIVAELADRGHDAEVISLRYGKLVVAAGALDAELIGYDRDNVLAVLETALPGVVNQLQIRVRR